MVIDDGNRDVVKGCSAVVVAAVQSRLEHRLWEVVDSAVSDIAVQSRSWHRLWEIVEVADFGVEIVDGTLEATSRRNVLRTTWRLFASRGRVTNRLPFA